MSSSRSISLEIYGLKGGRWSIHANYSIHQRDECLENAKELDAKGRFEAVCVVRETYSKDSNTARQAVIYHSPKLTSPPPVAAVTENAGSAPKPAAPAAQQESGDTDGAWRKKGDEKKPSKRAAPKKKRKSTPKPMPAPTSDGPTLADVLPRLLGVASVSLMGALTVAYIAYVLVQFLPSFGIVPGKTVSQSIIISVFLVSFIFIFVPLLKRYVPTIQASGRRQPQLATAHPSPAPNLESETSGSLDNGPAASVEMDDDFDDSSGDLPDTDAVESETEDAAPSEPVEDDGEKEESADADGEKAVPVAKGKKPDVSGEMLKFIRDSLEPLAKAGHPLNAFNRFGLTLFFSGAGEYMASRHRLSEQEMSDILCSHVQILGHTEEMARGFCGNIEEYLVNPKYFQMYEKGRSALAGHMQNPDGELSIVEAIDEWNDPTSVTSKNAKEFVAVLFTDIVGSTALTQERGDDAAQLVVHEHNAIVRDALALHGGKEIKHTGDGIMATFAQITNAVEGAVAMQEACQRSNGANPDLGLGLCIGVNAGEPIHEDGDIFGTPVQMAARVLSKAEGEEIAVSNLVREMCTGKSYKFAKKGDYELKGFPELVPIFLLEWKGGLNAPVS